jgi:hypothetical protein
MSSSASSSTPTPGASTSNGTHPMLTNNDEKNRYAIHRMWYYILFMPCSVVIKVGMVGDSQIGKTSLMVKYVEGSFDEDYIQTLGTFHSSHAHMPFLTVVIRRQLYGEDNLSAANNDHILHLGPGRAARIREHASTRLQRRRSYPIHVRPLSKVNTQLSEGVVSPIAGIQQGTLTFTLAFLWANPDRHRPRSHFSSAPSLTPFRRFRATSKRRSRSRPSVSPRRCTRLSSFAQHLRPSTCKRSSKSCSQRHLTSNASFPRSRESASPYCSTLMCECPTGRTAPLVPSAYHIRADCTIHTPPTMLSGLDATSFCAWVLWTQPVSLSSAVLPHVSRPACVVYILFCPLLHSSSLRSNVAAAYHAPHRSIALLSPHTSQSSPLFVSVFPALYWSHL